MEKRNISYFVVGLLLISSFAAIGLGKEAGASNEMTVNLQFSEPSLIEETVEKATYVTLNVNGANEWLHTAGQPMLPVRTTNLNFAFGTNILNVEFTPQEIKTMVLPDKIIPAPEPVIPDLEQSTVQINMDQTIYNSANFFPDNWVSYNTGGGLDNNGDEKTFLTIQTYPARYNPITNTIQYVETGVLTITYEEPANPMTFGSGYDLVIIAPQKFSNELQKLVDAKNGHGVTTMLKTTENIYTEFTGADKPEQIKYFIKYAKETWGTKYILLVGGLKSLLIGSRRDDKNQGSEDWYVPARYSNNYAEGTPSNNEYDPGYLCDLYYADIYNSTGGFDSWDSNHNGVFAEWKGINKDRLDFYPDVYVGRLPCRNTFEVRIMVNKIINYEKTLADPSWYDRFVTIGGDSHDDRPYGTNYPEGEVVCDYIIDTYMTDFTPIRLFSSNKNTDPTHTPETANIISEVGKMSTGCGYLLFDGHGNPLVWDTHWVDDFSTWVGAINVGDFLKLRNGGKLPVTVVGGCHNSMFNNTVLGNLQDNTTNYKFTWVYGNPVPESFSWWLTRKIGGGSIATMGNTGLGYGSIGDFNSDGIPDCTQYLGGYQEIKFFESLSESSTKILGEIWGGTISKYLDTFPGMDDQVDCKTVQEWPLIGDPSLKIGGYSASEGLKASIEDAASGVIAAPGENVQLTGIANDGQAPYTYAWDFNEDGVYTDATGSTVSNSWNLPGAYWVSLKVTDANGKTDVYDTVVCIELSASTPTRPDGQAQVKPGQTYTYATSISSTNWDTIYYKFDWGDGTQTEWLTEPTASHTWAKKGIYQVKAQALMVKGGNKIQDEYQQVSQTGWSDPLAIRAPRYGFSMPLLEKLFERFPNAFPILRHLLGV